MKGGKGILKTTEWALERGWKSWHVYPQSFADYSRSLSRSIYPINKRSLLLRLELRAYPVVFCLFMSEYWKAVQFCSSELDFFYFSCIFLGPHRCSKLCNSTLSISDLERVKHNPRAIPLLLKWKRLGLFSSKAFSPWSHGGHIVPGDQKSFVLPR